MATSCRLSTVVTSSSMVSALLSSTWWEADWGQTKTGCWLGQRTFLSSGTPQNEWIRLSRDKCGLSQGKVSALVLNKNGDADLCGGNNRLHQKVNERLIVHWRQDPILHQAHLQTQSSQLPTGNRAKHHRVRKEIFCTHWSYHGAFKIKEGNKGKMRIWKNFPESLRGKGAFFNKHNPLD